MVKTGLVSLALLSLLLVSTFAFAYPMPALAGSPTFEVSKAQPDKPAYYIGETVTINFELKWQYLTQNYTVNIELWNSTDKIATLESSKLIDGTHNANGSYSTTYQRTDLTSEVGTKEYTIKVIDTSSLLTIASASFQVVTQEKSLYMSAAWDDANDDRKIDTSESVTFTIYITWTFANASETYSLKVNDNGVEKIVDTVSVSAGSGSATKTYVTAFENEGSYTLTFWLENADGEQVISKSINVNVGGETSQAQASIWEQLAEQIKSALEQYSYAIIIILVVVIITVVIIKYK